MTERRRDLIEQECRVDDRQDAVGVDRGNHLLLLLARADGDALDRHVPGHRQRRGDFSGNPGQHADQGNMAADPRAPSNAPAFHLMTTWR